MKSKITLILFSISFFILSGTCRAQTPPDNSCVQCHSDYFDDMKGSIHSKEGIYCNSCHGGDPVQATQESAHNVEKGYLAVPDKQQIANMCGTCHADVERMNFYGIPTDQLAQYKTSKHGKALFNEGDTHVAVCTDCHSYHDIVSAKDPASPVYPFNIVKTCGHCHSNEKLMHPYNIPSDIPDKYTNSVHGKALFEKQDISVATCVSCHGSHGAVPPQVKNIVAACGQCHINERKYFLESVHAKLAESGQFPECIACHSNHDVAPASLASYETMCSQCHQQGDAGMRQGEKMLSMLSQSEKSVEEAAILVKQAEIEGLFVEEETAGLEEAKTKAISMKPLQHTLSVEKISELNEDVNSGIGRIKNNIQDKREDLARRKIALVFVWIFIFLMVAALWKRYQQYTHHK